jgi:hypothetical protein
VHSVLALAILWSVTLVSPALGQKVAPRPVATPRPLITQSVDESQLTTLKGNTHPLARAEFELGSAATNLPMKRMLLVLKRGPDQEAALEKILDDQQKGTTASIPVPQLQAYRLRLPVPQFLRPQ